MEYLYVVRWAPTSGGTDEHVSYSVFAGGAEKDLGDAVQSLLLEEASYHIEIREVAPEEVGRLVFPGPAQR